MSSSPVLLGAVRLSRAVMPPKKRPSGRAMAKAKEKSKEKARAKPKPTITKAQAESRRAGITMNDVGFVGLNSELVLKMDVDVFARHPAPCGLGGKQEHVSIFPGGGSKSGFAYLLQRLSDYVYSVSAYCADPSRGARFTMLTIDKKRKPQQVWVPPAGCGLGGSLAPGGACVVDTVHLDLVRSADGKTRLIKGALLTAVSSTTTHLFLNSFHDAASIAVAIAKCGELQVVTFLESQISPAVVDALAAKGTSLRGVVAKGCYCERLTTSDECWARLFTASQSLLWFQADFMGALGPIYPIGPQAWECLPPSLHVLTYTGNIMAITGQRSGYELLTLGHLPAADEDVVRAAAVRLPALKWFKTGNA